METSVPGGPRDLKQLPWLEASDGAFRRVGVELAVTGMTLDALAGCVAKFLGLDAEEDGSYERQLTGHANGDEVIEVDFDLLKRIGHETYSTTSLRGGLWQAAEDILALAVRSLDPLEIVSPPLPRQRVVELEALFVRPRVGGPCSGVVPATACRYPALLN